LIYLDVSSSEEL